MKNAASQQGATLVVALIILILMSLFAISAFNSTSNNLRVVGNTQAVQESLSAAQEAIESTISSTTFYTNPNGVAASPVLVDINGDGVTDYTAKLTPAPQCYRAKTIQAADLPVAPKDPSITDVWAPCRPSAAAGGTYVDSDVTLTGVNPESCANSEWNIRAEVTDSATKTQVATNQGVAVVVFGNQVSSYCN